MFRQWTIAGAFSTIAGTIGVTTLGTYGQRICIHAPKIGQFYNIVYSHGNVSAGTNSLEMEADRTKEKKKK